MRKLRSAVLGVLCFPLAATAANTFLVRPSGDSSTLKIEAFGIQFPVRTVDVQPSPKLTVFVYLDGMSPTAWDRTKTALGSLRNATKNGGFRFLVVSGGEVRAITWKTADQFASEIRKLAPTTFTDEKPDWFADSSIVELLPEATEDWESLVIVSEPRLINNPIIRDYLQTLAVHQLVTNKLRLSFWAVAAASPDDAAATWNRVTQASCGELLPPDEPPTAWVERVKSSQCQAVSFDPPQILAGFVPYNAKLLNPQQPAMELPALLLGPTSQPLTVSKYAELLRTFENARTAANSNLGDVVREALQQVLQGNPMHIEARRFAADLYKRQNDWATALQLMEPIALLSPLDADLFRELGDLQFELKNWSESENQFKRSQQLKPLQPATLERMSVIREQLGDLAGAADYIGQVIPTNTNRLDLYLRHARLLDRLQRLADASKSFEKALELDASLDDVRIRLAEIYKSIGNDVRPAELLNARANIPGDVSSRMQYAQLAEKLGLPSQALTFYASAIEADACHEPAYFGRAKLLVAADRTEDAYATVIAGLKANEKSLRLHFIKIDFLEKGDRLFQARDAIRQASELLPDEEPILRHLANVNDVFGNHGGETYERWAAAMERTGKASSEIQQALERGFTVALRDGEQQAADRIREKLARFSSTVLRPGARPLTGSAIVVPGGIPGLSQAVGIDPTVSPARFVAEYGRAILRTATGPSTQRDKYKERIRLYLKTVQALKAFGRESGDSTEISIDVQTNQGVDRAEKILDLLGWRIRRSRNAFLLEVGTDEEAAVRQTFGAPLGVDEFSMKSRLEQRQPFTFRIVDQRAALIFDESYWFGTILKEPKPKRGFLEEMLENPSVTRLYIGLSSMNAETQRAIVQAVQPDQLLKRAVRLSFYASSIAIENGRVVVPGGEQASVP
jgi:tetratricopeptide (TPR) repeat protein